MPPKPSRSPFQAEVLRNACARRGLTQTDLAREMGVDKTAVTYWMRGNAPGPNIVVKLCEYFGIPFEHLWVVPPAARDLAYYRIRKGMYARELADLLGESAQVLRLVESGKRQRSLIDTSTWAAVLDLTDEEFNDALEITQRLSAQNKRVRRSRKELVIEVA